MIAFTLRSFLTACLVFAAVAGSAQLDAVFYEVHYVDDGSLAAYPEGASTYRIYAAMDAATFTQDGALLTADEGVAWQWYLDGELIPGATGQTHEATENGDYHVVVTSADGCDATGDAVTITIISVEELNLTAVVYPNPVSDVAHVSFDKQVQGTWQLHDVQGKTVLEGEVNGTTMQVDLSGLATGQFTLNVQSNGQLARLAILVQR